MSYQVLARKWRPQNFQELVGQEHVLKALIHALDQQRLHHAYLFTGTRGVGKTTIGRIFAKCLNCESGISSKPCGVCDTCREITEGRFVDLIEIDAASRTKVEEMRELLENVQYAPTRGRFKVYLIDEVHMLSSSSFNALLKTLEEPPEHVKFLFATTDPQKLPVTILSRCLQFGLKNMTPERVVQHLSYVLQHEQVPFEEPALWLIARASGGSMRDALSLTDQAIAFGHGSVAESSVCSMLGTIDQRVVYRLLATLANRDAAGLLGEVAKMADFAPDYADVLASLMSILHRMAVEQAVPGSCDNALGDKEAVIALARSLSGEDVQLFYQIALLGRKDLLIAPDPRAGFEMVMLRMIAFRPLLPGQVAENSDFSLPSDSGSSGSSGSNSRSLAAASNSVQMQTDATTENTSQVELPGKSVEQGTLDPIPSDTRASQASLNDSQNSAPVALASVVENVAVTSSTPVANAHKITETTPVIPEQSLGLSPPDYDDSMIPDEEDDIDYGAINAGMSVDFSVPTESAGVSDELPVESTEAIIEDGDNDQTHEAFQLPPGKELHEFWPLLIDQLGLSGLTYNLASNAQAKLGPQQVVLAFDEGHYRLLNDNHRQRIKEGFNHFYGQSCRVEFVSVSAVSDTPQAWKDTQKALRLRQAIASLENDSNVKALLQRFDGKLLIESVRPL